MRVALVDPSLFTLPYDAALATGLQAEGHEVTLYGRRASPAEDGSAKAPLEPSFYRLAERPALRALPGAARLAIKGVDHVASMLGLLRRLRRQRVDVIHFQWLPLPIVDGRFLGALRRIAPLVLTVHDTDPFNGNPASIVQRLGTGGSLDRFDRLIVHTASGRERLLRQGADPGRVSVLPHGLLGDRPAAPAVDAMQGRMTFLLFGKIKPYKGADLLIEAFARLPATLRETARVHVVGKPYMDLAPLRALAAEQGVHAEIDPHFVADEEVAGLFGAGTVAVFPYREIEASGVLSLAIAHGRPVIATRIGGFAESIADGEHGLLVPPGDADALSRAMARFLTDRAFAAACARNVAALAAEVPDWPEIARRTGAIYEAARVG